MVCIRTYGATRVPVDPLYALCGARGSLIVKDICKIDVIDELLQWMTDAQKWFGTNKLGPLLAEFCKKHYDTSRAFIFPAETRFAGKLLQIKRFYEYEICASTVCSLGTVPQIQL